MGDYDGFCFIHSWNALKSLFFFQQQALAGTLVTGAGSAIETDPFRRQQTGPPAGMSGCPVPGGLGTSELLSVGVTAQWHVFLECECSGT